MHWSAVTLSTMKRSSRLFAIFLALSLRPILATAADVNLTPAIQDLPGKVIFHGRYNHRNTGRPIAQPSELWLR